MLIKAGTVATVMSDGRYIPKDSYEGTDFWMGDRELIIIHWDKPTSQSHGGYYARYFELYLDGTNYDEKYEDLIL